MNHRQEPDEAQLLLRLKQGDKEAANDLIERYFNRVVLAAETHLRGRRVHATSGEDIAASVFESLWQRASENRFDGDELQDASELWRLLCKMVDYKAKDHLRRESALKRGGGELVGESGLGDVQNGVPMGINSVPDRRPSTWDIASFREQHTLLLKSLESETLQQVATLRLDGFRVAEIAEVFSKSERWVRRKLELIRKTWKLRIVDLNE